MSTKAELKKVLDRLIGDADEQTQLFESSQQKLYITLAEAYMWWREASKIEGFLEDLYQERGLLQRGSEEKFTRLVRLVWQLDWSGYEAPKLQNWARALRGLHKEYETNTDAYRVDDPKLRLAQFIRSEGGIGAVGRLVTPLQMTDDELALAVSKGKKKFKKTDIDYINEEKIKLKHIELGEKFYSTEKPYLKNIVNRTDHLSINRKGFAVALIRKSLNGGYDLLSITNNDDIIHQTIVETYKRNDSGVPSILNILAECAATQALPMQFEKYRNKLNDSTDITSKDGKTKLRTSKRMLLRPKFKDILLSECRADCSVVTIAKPYSFPKNVDKEITLRSVNHKYIEQEMIQQRDLCFFTTQTKQIELLKDPSLVATHRLQTINTVTNKIHNLYFYDLNSHPKESIGQAAINFNNIGSPSWKAEVTPEWINEINSKCVINWLNEFGSQINRDRHKTIALNLSTSFEIQYDGVRGSYTKSETSISKPKIFKPFNDLSIILRSKDFFTVFNGMLKKQIQSNIHIAANEDILTLTYSTNNAEYVIAIPTCSNRSKFNKSAFTVYEATDGN